MYRTILIQTVWQSTVHGIRVWSVKSQLVTLFNCLPLGLFCYKRLEQPPWKSEINDQTSRTVRIHDLLGRCTGWDCVCVQESSIYTQTSGSRKSISLFQILPSLSPLSFFSFQLSFYFSPYFKWPLNTVITHQSVESTHQKEQSSMITFEF